MKKILSIILCLITILGLSGCYSSESKKLAKEIRKEAEQIAVEYIKDKYGFKPQVKSVQEIKKGSDYSIMKTPTKEVLVEMSYKGHKFATFVAGENKNGKCYDNYEQEKLTKLLEKYMRDIFPVKEMDLKITAVAGYQSGYIANMPKNLIHEKVSNNLFSIISNEKDPLNVYYLVEFSSPENIAETIQRQDFEELYTLPDDEFKNIERRIILLNYWNKEDIGKITPEHIKFGKKQEESYYYDNISIYAREIKKINIDLFQDGGGISYTVNPKPIDYGQYILQTNGEIEYIDTCSNTIKELDPKHSHSNAKEIIGCHYIRTKNEDSYVKIYVKKEEVGFKSDKFGPNMVFVSRDSFGLNSPKGNEVGEYYFTSVKGTVLGLNSFFLVKDDKNK